MTSGLYLPGLSRRGFLRGAGLTAAALGGSSLLAACGTEGAKVAAGSCNSTDLSADQKSIVFSNWIGYVDPVKAKDTSTLEKFQQESGITVDYRNGDVNDNETFFAKVSPQLQDCKSTGRDAFVVTDYMAARMIELGWIRATHPDARVRDARQAVSLAERARARASVKDPTALDVLAAAYAAAGRFDDAVVNARSALDVLGGRAIGIKHGKAADPPLDVACKLLGVLK